MVFSYNLGYTSTQWVLSKPLLSEQGNTQGTELAPRLAFSPLAGGSSLPDDLSFTGILKDFLGTPTHSFPGAVPRSPCETEWGSRGRQCQCLRVSGCQTVTVKQHSGSDWIWNYHGNAASGDSMRAFPERSGTERPTLNGDSSVPWARVLG